MLKIQPYGLVGKQKALICLPPLAGSRQDKDACFNLSLTWISGQDEADGGSWMDRWITAVHRGTNPPQHSQLGCMGVCCSRNGVGSSFPNPESWGLELELQIAEEVTPAIQCFLHYPYLHT